MVPLFIAMMMGQAVVVAAVLRGVVVAVPLVAVAAVLLAVAEVVIIQPSIVI
jgi:hypothetical protein